MGSRELSNRAQLKADFMASLLPSGMAADAKEALAKTLAKTFHATYQPGKPEATVQTVLDIVMGVGGGTPPTKPAN
jgi:hypothetical protein